MTTKKQKSEKTEHDNKRQLVILLEEELITRIEQHGQRLGRQLSLDLSRSAVIRSLIVDALERAEAQQRAQAANSV